MFPHCLVTTTRDKRNQWILALCTNGEARKFEALQSRIGESSDHLAQEILVRSMFRPGS